jgi:hypothetical protein
VCPPAGPPHAYAIGCAVVPWRRRPAARRPALRRGRDGPVGNHAVLLLFVRLLPEQCGSLLGGISRSAAGKSRLGSKVTAQHLASLRSIAFAVKRLATRPARLTFVDHAFAGVKDSKSSV